MLSVRPGVLLWIDDLLRTEKHLALLLIQILQHFDSSDSSMSELYCVNVGQELNHNSLWAR
jgi:hypothetical protein